MISWVLKDCLAIGEWGDEMVWEDTLVTVDARLFFDEKMIPMKEDIDAIDAVVRLIVHNLLDEHRKVIVFCDAGMDRSPYIVAKVLMCLLGDIDTLADAYAYIRKVRPAICEHYEWEAIGDKR